MLSIIPDFPNPNIHYSFSFKPMLLFVIKFPPQKIWYNQLLSNWQPINYLLITHWFHWCHRLVSSRVSSGKRHLLCGRPAKLTGMTLEGRSGCTERYRIKEIGPHLLTLRFENKAKRRKVTKSGSTFFWFLLSCFRRFRCLCSKLLPFRHIFCW